MIQREEERDRETKRERKRERERERGREVDKLMNLDFGEIRFFTQEFR